MADPKHSDDQHPQGATPTPAPEAAEAEETHAAAPADDQGDGDAMAALIAERDELRDRFVRALADAENTRKRGERDRREAEQYGATRLARDMLSVYDNLSRALDAAGDEQRAVAAALIEGVELTMRELLNSFARHGITPIRPEKGEPFDPQRHQAMFEAPVPGTRAGEIIEVMTEGFIIHDRLLRPAHVGVSSAPAGGAEG